MEAPQRHWRVGLQSSSYHSIRRARSRRGLLVEVSAIWKLLTLIRDLPLWLSTVNEKQARPISFYFRNAMASLDRLVRASSTRRGSLTRAGVLSLSMLMKMGIRNCCSAERIPPRTEASDGSFCSYRMIDALTQCR